MRLTHLGHASLLVEIADARVLIDPGVWSAPAYEQRDLDAVLVTHQHPDHVDRERLPELLRANPQARLAADPQTAALLQDAGLDVEPFGPGARWEVEGATVTGVGELHALIHEDLPRVTNTGMLLAADGEPTFFHPGDALDADPGEVTVLAFPLNAPWQRSREMTEFLRSHAAPHAVPIHDGLLNRAGRDLYLGQARSLGSPDTHVHDLAGAGPTTFGLT